MDLFTPIEEVSGIGPQYQKKLKKLGIKTIEDLVFHFPYRYEDFSNLIPISRIKSGEAVCVHGKILEIKNTRTWKKRMFLTNAIIEDGSGAIKVIWFNQPYLTNVLKKGNFVCLAGKAIVAKNGIYLSNPVYEKIGKIEEIQDSKFRLQNPALIHTGRLVPVYPETKGLSSRWLRMILKPLLIKLKNEFSDFIPEKIKRQHKLLLLQKAIWQIHFPDTIELAKQAQRRFCFEELFLIELLVLREKIRLAQRNAVSIPINLEFTKNFIQGLPFFLTIAQKKSLWQILKDLSRNRPMNRLLEGDVGSGKTIVAMISALNVANKGYQTALMAPTEILAKQHFRTFSKFLKKKRVNIGLLTRGNCQVGKRKILKKKILEKILNGKIDILIGTHSLIQKEVKFGNLALVVLDEQHRFGIEQRARLCQNSGKDQIPHLLSMTATPIPRTLAITIYGDLDISLIDEMPKGRKKIITKIIAPEKRKEAYEFIRKEVKKGRQIFVICPRIEKPDEKNFKNLSWAETKAVKEEKEKLSKIIFPDLKVDFLHGKMKSKEKEETMKKFKEKKIDILVSTSVVEVGIDIANASIMMIESAERFGLAQLHQFRGRVGRGPWQSYCFLFTESPAKKTNQRLRALLLSESGFILAQKDLEIRGPGELFGKNQWGFPDLAMKSLKDIFLVEQTRQSAKAILEEDPSLRNYPFLKKKLEKFQEKIHLE